MSLPFNAEGTIKQDKSPHQHISDRLPGSGLITIAFLSQKLHEEGLHLITSLL
jgi:hypothetical protein